MHRSRDKTKEHVQELVNIPGGYEMICASQSHSIDMLSHVIFERKWQSRDNLDVALSVSSWQMKMSGSGHSTTLLEWMDSKIQSMILFFVSLSPFIQEGIKLHECILQVI